MKSIIVYCLVVVFVLSLCSCRNATNNMVSSVVAVGENTEIGLANLPLETPISKEEWEANEIPFPFPEVDSVIKKEDGLLYCYRSVKL